MTERSLTLIELIVVIGLIGVVLIGIASAVAFFIVQVNANIERSNINAQINYAFEDMKIRCISAAKVGSGSTFNSDGETKNEFSFQGEKDIYNITPDNLTDNYLYTYKIDNGDLVLETKDLAGNPLSREILVEKEFNPTIEFIYILGKPPNFLRVKIKATSNSNSVPLGANPTVSREDGIRFWYIDIVQ